MSAIVVVTAVRPETRAVLAALSRPRRVHGTRRWEGRTGGRDVVVLECGVGGVAAGRAIASAPPDAALVVSAGFAGALVGSLTPGDVVVPRRLVWEQAEDGGTAVYDVPQDLHAAVVAAMPQGARVESAGAMLSSPTVVASPAAKADAGRRWNAVAVEMEACALATWASGRSVPFVVVRTILDAADLSLETLPPDVGERWSARAALVMTPSVWPLLLALRGHVATASHSLRLAMAAFLRAPLPVCVAESARA
jgi:nucleoside phosphorylase